MSGTQCTNLIQMELRPGYHSSICKHLFFLRLEIGVNFIKTLVQEKVRNFILLLQKKKILY